MGRALGPVLGPLMTSALVNEAHCDRPAGIDHGASALREGSTSRKGMCKLREEPSALGDAVKEGFLEVVLSQASKVK